MKILILSDIHGNLPALEFVLANEKNADCIISLGDVVNYGPWSNECVELLNEQKNIILLLGNHEEAFIEEKYYGTNEIAKMFFNTCFKNFNRKDLINLYKPNYIAFNFHFTHTINNSYIFKDSEVNLSENLFIGHSHRQFTIKQNNFELINVGSVGQNREDIDIINYVTFDTETTKIDLVAKQFRNDKLISEMKSLNYPNECINYILNKRK